MSLCSQIYVVGFIVVLYVVCWCCVFVRVFYVCPVVAVVLYVLLLYNVCVCVCELLC